MKTLGAAVLGASVLMLATGAFAQPQRSVQGQNPKAATVHKVEQTQAIQGNDTSGTQQSTPLFTLGNVGVHLWAPVEPSYNANANRNLAADPLWEANMATTPSSF